MVVRGGAFGRGHYGALFAVFVLLAFAGAHELLAPALCIAIIALIYIFGLREKWDNEVSAYSVFNKGGARLAGTFTAEQFDSRMRSEAPHEVALEGVVARPEGKQRSSSRVGRGPNTSADVLTNMRHKAAEAAIRRTSAS
ncbi:hypothetical protein CYMTET_32140 [Cymbomonas tetramitiformis]|uniref:SAYSvFN domain-containing protein n=1 Tax=Cymbomonas tetramitiformis TaxID=36881 RepID=A0AAE0FFL0_9CHLO|nr:hypothetical protein CYMTET_32140 [Cymbomonas tetramitiformis]